jgi:hypothetical protein
MTAPDPEQSTFDCQSIGEAYGTVDQFVGESLVIPLAMVVSGELSQNPTKVPFAERHDSIQAFFFH